MTGSGNSIDSRTTGWLSSQIVSPVCTLRMPYRGGDVPGVDVFDVLALVGVHLQQPPDPVAAASRRVQHVGAGLEHAGVDPEKGELPDVRVGHDLEDQGGKGRIIARGPLHRSRCRPGRCRRWPGPLEARAESRTTASSSGWTPLFLNAEPHRTGTSFSEIVPLRRPRRSSSSVRAVSFEVLLHQLIVRLTGRLDHLLARLLRRSAKLLGNLCRLEVRPQGLVLVQDRLLPDEVDDAKEARPRPQSEAGRNGVRAEPLSHHADRRGR